MIETLTVRNLAIVREARLELKPGLNVITGETGAGKSVLLGSLGLLLGERAERDSVRAGEKEASVEAVLRLGDTAVLDRFLEEAGLPPCEEGMLLLKRAVLASGGGRAFVNSAPAALQVLKRLGEMLVDLHGPHEHQSLLSPAAQLEILDAFGGLESIRHSFREAYGELRAREAELAALAGDGASLPRELETLEFQAAEIERAGLREGMEEEIREEFSRHAHARAIADSSAAALSLLTGEEGSAFAQLVAARRELEGLRRYLGEAAGWLEILETAAIQVQEVAAGLENLSGSLDFSPERAAALEEQLAGLERLKRKYGPGVPEILKFLEKAAKRLDDLRNRGAKVAALEAEIARRLAGLEVLGGKLRQARQKAAAALARKVGEELPGLGFPGDAFAPSLEPAEPGPTGMDRAEFAFAPNPGEPARPLRAIASSGEISRVMLALKAVLSDQDRVPVLVFDEIDANVGGEMGNAIGEKLAAIAARRQVICVTHLPQVAAFGTSHLRVQKTAAGGRAEALISSVEGEERVEEVARMLGGKGLTSVALRHARELLALRAAPRPRRSRRRSGLS